MPDTAPCVCMNAWLELDTGDVTYSDGVNDPVDGWSVYRRIPDPRGPFWPFDSSDERDFETREEALAYAEQLAAEHGLEIREY